MISMTPSGAVIRLTCRGRHRLLQRDEVPAPCVQRDEQPGPGQLTAVPLVRGVAEQLGEQQPPALEVLPGQLDARLRGLVREVDDDDVPGRSLPAPGEEVVV